MPPPAYYMTNQVGIVGFRRSSDNEYYLSLLLNVLLQPPVADRRRPLLICELRDG